MIKISGVRTIGKFSAASVPTSANYTTASLLYTFNNPNAYSTSAYDQFGRSVAVSGNTVVIGALGEDDSGGIDSGKVYLFDATTGSLLRTINNPSAYSTTNSDLFGYSVAISGNTVVVGAYQEDDAGGVNSGKIYLFDAVTGSLLRTINNPSAYSTSAGDNFGISVAISGNTVVVGASAEDDAGGVSSGKAYLFDAVTGALLHTLDNPNAYSTSVNDNFGISVAISGNTVVVGASAEDDASGVSSGKAYLFDAVTGALLHTLDNPNAYSTSGTDYFGISVAISGNTVVVGARGEDDSGGIDSGKVYLFDATTGSLLHTLNNPNAYSTSGSDNFGYSVAISGNTVVASTYQEDDADGGQSGKVYLFDATTGSLLQILDNPNEYAVSAGDNFGYSVAIDGNTVVVGTPYEDDAGGTNSGKVYIYQLS